MQGGRASPSVVWLVGLAILVCFSGWEFVVASAAHTRAGPAVATAALTGASVAIARVVGQWHPALPAGVVALAVVVADLTSSTGLSGLPLAGPLGYGNADGILDAIGVAAALIVAVSCTRWWRAPWVGLGVLLTILAVVTKSAAGGSLAIVVFLVGCCALVTRLSSRVVAGFAALAMLLVFVMTVVLGHEYHPGREVQPRLERTAAQVLTYHRIELWHDALAITASHPLRGVGPQRFALASPTARGDPDLRWAHSGPLQQAAEAGVPGALLLAALFAWALIVTGLTRTSQGALAAAAVGALGVHSGIDYVLNFLAVPVACGVLVGSAAASLSPRRQRQSAALGQPGIPG